MKNLKTPGIFYAGTSGLVLAERNKLAFPTAFQNRSRLEYYASQFNSIEINSSFYKIPRGDTYEKWAALVPDDFKFTVKLWKGITHETVYSQADLEKFFSAINRMGSKKGCLLIQFAATSALTKSTFVQLMEDIRNLNKGWRIAVEFRNHKWYNENIFQILNQYDASLVLHDMPKSMPATLNSGASFVYFRFHGEKGDFRGSYPDDFLHDKASEITTWLEQGKDVFAYFNNSLGNAAGNLKILYETVGKVRVFTEAR